MLGILRKSRDRMQGLEGKRVEVQEVKKCWRTALEGKERKGNGGQQKERKGNERTGIGREGKGREGNGRKWKEMDRRGGG